MARILRISSTTAYKELQRFIDTRGREGIPVILVGGQKRIPRQKLEALAGGPIRMPMPTPVPLRYLPSSTFATTGRPRRRSAQAAGTADRLPSFRSTLADDTMTDRH